MQGFAGGPVTQDQNQETYQSYLEEIRDFLKNHLLFTVRFLAICLFCYFIVCFLVKVFCNFCNLLMMYKLQKKKF